MTHVEITEGSASEDWILAKMLSNIAALTGEGDVERMDMSEEKRTRMERCRHLQKGLSRTRSH
jgi:hypothetical protein